MNRPEDRQSSNAPGNYANQGPMEQATSPSTPGKEEQHQTTREKAPTDQERQSAGLPPGGSASASGPAEGNPADMEREERIRRRAYELWEEGGRQDNRAEEHWYRAAQDLDRQEAELQRSGTASRNRT
jgi:hypothetical protein